MLTDLSFLNHVTISPTNLFYIMRKTSFRQTRVDFIKNVFIKLDKTEYSFKVN